jgi:hypothetical protein
VTPSSDTRFFFFLFFLYFFGHTGV